MSRSRSKEPFAQAVKGPGVEIGIAIKDRRLQRQPHRAHLLLGLRRTGFCAIEIHDRAVHIQVTAKQVHELGFVRHRPVVAPVALVHRPKTNPRKFLLLGELERPTGEVAERQAADQLTF
jgi:hypothetical protein